MTAWLLLAPASAQTALSGDPIRIGRAAGAITIDGALDDAGWRGVPRIEKWYETNPGDNIEPSVGNVGVLAYDDRYLYAGFEFDDPDPGSIRAPLGDRDHVPSVTDYGGIIVDSRNSGRSAVLLLTNPRGVQYDAVTDDASGENSSPDFFWESAARITDRGWTLEMRVPFSSLRYSSGAPQTWGILLYRNRPRNFRYQMFSARLPRGGNCFICRSNPLVGLDALPTGSHFVLAPFLTASQTARPAAALGSPLRNDALDPDLGLDLKWTPSADHALDFTVKPDFSQVESDTAQIAANERFALFFPEKRPFFLEGVDLLETPIQAVYTRTITAPRWGSRATGKIGATQYTVLVAEDEGGGSVVVPGPNGSTLAAQDFESRAIVARAKRGVGRSFVSLLFTARETDGQGHNRVAGPDFEWRPTSRDVVTGQILLSDTRTPNRPDLSASWDGRSMTSHAALLQWGRNTTHLDLSGQYKDLGDGFRADTGFVPQVGYRKTYGEAGYTVFPKGAVSRLRTFVFAERQTDSEGALITRLLSPGVWMDARWNGFIRLRFQQDRVRSGALTFPRAQFVYTVQSSPSRSFSRIGVDGFVGQEVDFANSRRGRGGNVNVTATLQPTDHLELTATQSQRWLNVDDPSDEGVRLFTARVSRVRSVYTFTARSFVRAIGQYVSTNRNPSLYLTSAARRSATFSGSVLFAYKLNWQSVVFLGYGDDRELSDLNRLERTSRQLFVKMSYAFQR